MSGFATDTRVSSLATEIGTALRSVDDAVRMASNTAATARGAAVAAASNAETASAAASDAATKAAAALATAESAQDSAGSASAAAATAGALAAAAMPFPVRADAVNAVPPASVTTLRVGDLTYVADTAGTALITGDGRTWAPAGRASHRHWGFPDSFTLTPDMDWQSIVEAYDGIGAITVADGTYTATRRLKPRGVPSLRGQSLGGATIIANWEFRQGTGAYLWNLNLSAQDKTDLWLRATQAYVDFRDVRIDAADAGNTMAQFASCAASDVRFTASQRDLVVDLGPNVAEGWDFDSGSNVKVAANTTDKRVKLLNRVPDGSDRGFWIFDQSRMIADGINLGNPNTGVKGGIGISARRGSVLTFQQSAAAVDGPHNRITEQARGIIVRQNSTASFQGSYVALNAIGIQIQDGAWCSYATGGLVFSGNTADIDDQNAKAGVQYLGRARNVPLLQFTSGAATVAAGSTAYLGAAYAGTDMAVARLRVPRDGTLRNLSVRSSLSPGAGQSFAVAVMRGSAATALAVTIADANSDAADAANNVPVVAGDLICIRVISSAGAAARTFTATVELE